MSDSAKGTTPPDEPPANPDEPTAKSKVVKEARPNGDGEKPVGGPTTPVSQNDNSFFGAVTIQGDAHFGTTNGTASPVRAVTTGIITSARVEEALAHFVEPGCYRTTRELLRQEHVLILDGAPGIGRQCAALSLLRSLAPGDINRIEPTVTYEDLAGWPFKPRTGYLVPEHVIRDRGPTADFNWETVVSRLRELKSYLVLTGSGTVGNRNVVSWERPDPAEVLHRYLDDLVDQKELVDYVVERLPEDWTMRAIVECAARLKRDPGAFDAAFAVFDIEARRDVSMWFSDENRTRHDFIEVAVLVFGQGTSQRQFEKAVDAFENILDEHLPRVEESKSEIDPARTLPSSRLRRSDLIQLIRVPGNVKTRHVLRFPTPHHTLAVVAGLHQRFEIKFWDALNEWILERVDDPLVTVDEVLAVAEGLATLAQIDTDEVVDLLDDMAVSGKRLATECTAWTISQLCRREGFSSIALDMVVSWLRSPENEHRISAGVSLVGDLGLSYPGEAARRLWQLIAQDEKLGEEAVVAPALLFANLVRNDGDASLVLDLVLEKVERFNRRGQLTDHKIDLRMVDLSLGTAYWILALPADSDKGKDRASFKYLTSRPEAADTIGRLWAAILLNRRFRLHALNALWAGLDGSPARAEAGALLGPALSRALPSDQERAYLARDLRTIEKRRRRKPDEDVESMADIIIKALELGVIELPRQE